MRIKVEPITFIAAFQHNIISIGSFAARKLHRTSALSVYGYPVFLGETTFHSNQGAYCRRGGENAVGLFRLWPSSSMPLAENPFVFVRASQLERYAGPEAE